MAYSAEVSHSRFTINFSIHLFLNSTSYFRRTYGLSEGELFPNLAKGSIGQVLSKENFRKMLHGIVTSQCEMSTVYNGLSQLQNFCRHFDQKLQSLFITFCSDDDWGIQWNVSKVFKLATEDLFLRSLELNLIIHTSHKSEIKTLIFVTLLTTYMFMTTLLNHTLCYRASGYK